MIQTVNALVLARKGPNIPASVEDFSLEKAFANSSEVLYRLTPNFVKYIIEDTRDFAPIPKICLHVGRARQRMSDESIMYSISVSEIEGLFTPKEIVYRMQFLLHRQTVRQAEFISTRSMVITIVGYVQCFDDIVRSVQITLIDGSWCCDVCDLGTCQVGRQILFVSGKLRNE